MADLNQPPADFIASIERAKKERAAMVAAFKQAEEEITRVFQTLKAIYPDFKVSVLENSQTHHFPTIKYNIGSESHSTYKCHTILAVGANPARLKEDDPNIQAFGLSSWPDEPLFRLTITFGTRDTYGSKLLKTSYGLDQPGGFAVFVNDLALYCGVVYNGIATPTLSESARAILNPSPLTKFGIR